MLDTLVEPATHYNTENNVRTPSNICATNTVCTTSI